MLLPVDALFEEIYILFHDPWPKNKHHKNRLIQDDFLNLIAKHCKSTTKLYFRTDHTEYFSWAYKIFSKNKHWEISQETVLPVEEETVFQKRMGTFQTLVAKSLVDQCSSWINI